ncbi:MAG TPA: phosphoribosylformylglycinamidine synthase subunit PurQ [Gemmatimonadota bacterium]|nr:phosphoribosylformylglycinamidine synthase subunit PurQ [Gemmatimonadota bacterium]
MRFGIVRFPGSNCDQDCWKTVTEGLSEEASYLWHRDTSLEGADVILLPGGFGYGDYLRAGAIARFSPIMGAVEAFARDGGPVLGICNGFQILCEARLLPGALARNAGLRFLSHDVHLRVERTDTAFTAAYEAGQVLRMPLSHGEGRFVADEETLERLEGEGRVVFRYVDAEGRATAEANPNGSLRGIAGIANEAGNVVGLMPHPDRAYDAILGSADGLGVFRSVLQAAAGARP